MTMASDDDHEEQEEALVALINHRANEVQHLIQRISYYQSQLVEAKELLRSTESKLARHRSRRIESVSIGRPSLSRADNNGTVTVKEERSSLSPVRDSDCASSTKQHKPKPLLVIPSFAPLVKSKPVRGSKMNSNDAETVRGDIPNAVEVSNKLVVVEKGTKRKFEPKDHEELIPLVKSSNAETVRGDRPIKVSNELVVVGTREKGTKRKLDQKEHGELMPLVKSSSTPPTIRCSTVNLIASQHKRKMRTIAVSPVNDQQFVTSSLDGMVNLWKVQSMSSGASLISTTDCLSQTKRKWPEDIAWHPDGNSLFSVYSANDEDSQISVLDLNRTRGKPTVTFLEDKPHKKGIINSISFMPWEKTCFATGGSDHGVIFWDEKDDKIWKAKELHSTYHSSAVMGVAGLQQKNIVLSAGADKRIIGFDVHAEMVDFKHQLDSKCMSVLPNPRDFNLFMVHAGTLEMQLRLFDIRLRKNEIQSFGWKQESSESQSALISQSWSPDGFYITSGSADPVIHIFDIRYNSNKPSQSIRAHQKRVFKAVWLKSSPLIVSISSDLFIGFHKFTSEQ